MPPTAELLGQLAPPPTVETLNRFLLDIGQRMRPRLTVVDHQQPVTLFRAGRMVAQPRLTVGMWERLPEGDASSLQGMFYPRGTLDNTDFVEWMRERNSAIRTAPVEFRPDMIYPSNTVTPDIMPDVAGPHVPLPSARPVLEQSGFVPTLSDGSRAVKTTGFVPTRTLPAAGSGFFPTAGAVAPPPLLPQLAAPAGIAEYRNQEQLLFLMMYEANEQIRRDRKYYLARQQKYNELKESLARLLRSQNITRPGLMATSALSSAIWASELVSHAEITRLTAQAVSRLAEDRMTSWSRQTLLPALDFYTRLAVASQLMPGMFPSSGKTLSSDIFTYLKVPAPPAPPIPVPFPNFAAIQRLAGADQQSAMLAPTPGGNAPMAGARTAEDRMTRWSRQTLSPIMALHVRQAIGAPMMSGMLPSSTSGGGGSITGSDDFITILRVPAPPAPPVPVPFPNVAAIQRLIGTGQQSTGWAFTPGGYAPMGGSMPAASRIAEERMGAWSRHVLTPAMDFYARQALARQMMSGIIPSSGKTLSGDVITHLKVPAPPGPPIPVPFPNIPAIRRLIGDNQKPAAGAPFPGADWRQSRTILPGLAPGAIGRLAMDRGGDWTAGARMPISGAVLVNPFLGQMTLIAPPLRVASEKAEDSGTAVAFNWDTLTRGQGALDARGLSALRQVLPDSAQLIYPALPTRQLPAGAVNLRLAQPTVAHLLEAGYGLPPGAGIAQRAVSETEAAIGATPRAMPLTGHIVPGKRPAGRKGSLLPSRIDRPGGELPRVGSGQAIRGGALDYLGLPISLAPSLGGRSDLREAVSGNAASGKIAGIIRPNVFRPLQQALFPSFHSIEAEPDRPAWQKAAPSFGLRDSKPLTVFSPQAREPIITPSSPLPQFGGERPSALGSLPQMHVAEPAPVHHAMQAPGSQPLIAPSLPPAIGGAPGRSFRPIAMPSIGPGMSPHAAPASLPIPSIGAHPFVTSVPGSRPAAMSLPSHAGITPAPLPAPAAMSLPLLAGVTPAPMSRPSAMSLPSLAGVTPTPLPRSSAMPLPSLTGVRPVPLPEQPSLSFPPLAGGGPDLPPPDMHLPISPPAASPGSGMHARTNLVTRTPAMLYAPPAPHVRTTTAPLALQRSITIGDVDSEVQTTERQATGQAATQTQREGQHGVEINILATEVFTLLKKRLATEAIRRGRW